MTTPLTPPEIDWSTFPGSDGEPMAETYPNAVQMMDLMNTLQRLLQAQGRMPAGVGSNQFLYYNQYNGRDHLAPDVYVVFGIAPLPPKWQTWVQHKSPEIVFEITSESTYKEDRGKKREIYERLGVLEYYIFDPQQETFPPFLGYELREGRFEPLPLLPSGGIWSPLLRIELRPMMMEGTIMRPPGVYLRVVNPASGEPLPSPEEMGLLYLAAEERLTTEEQARWAAEERAVQVEARLSAEEQARRATEERLSAEEQARRATEERLSAEEQARRAAEERAAQAEEALRAALAALAQRQNSTPDQP